jgi:hypothetical protein
LVRLSARRSAVRRAGVAAIAIAALYVLALAYTGVQAHRHLRDAQAAVGLLRAGLTSQDTPRAEIDRHLRAVQVEARAARDLTDGPLWDVPASLPWAGRPFETVQGVSAGVAAVADDVLPPVRSVRDRLVGVDLTRDGGGLDLAPIAAAQAPLAQARAANDAALHEVRALPSTGIGTIDEGQRDLTAQLEEVSLQLRSAHEAVQLLPPMLGAEGPRHYFVAFQNNAEARGAGGLPGVYAVLRADRGKVSFEHYGVSGDFGGLKVSLKGLSPGFASHYQGAAPDRVFGNSTVSPHFPDGAELMMRFWKARTGQQLDGALAIDPNALAMMLKVTGPTTMADGTVLKASSVVSLVEKDAYDRFTDPVVRKQYLITVAKAIADDVLERGPAKGTALASAVAGAVDERRVLLYSTHAEEQRVIAARPVGGTLSDTSGLFSGVVINNGGGNKLDYYLHREVSYQGAACGAADPRATVTIRLTNRVPRSGLTDYVAGRADEPIDPVPEGTNRLLVGYYATKEAGFSDATLDGEPTFLAVDDERGRPVFTAELELEPGQTRTLVIRIEEPPEAKGPVTTLVQPLVLPQVTTIDLPDCGRGPKDG